MRSKVRSMSLYVTLCLDCDILECDLLVTRVFIFLLCYIFEAYAYEFRVRAVFWCVCVLNVSQSNLFNISSHLLKGWIDEIKT